MKAFCAKQARVSPLTTQALFLYIIGLVLRVRISRATRSCSGACCCCCCTTRQPFPGDRAPPYPEDRVSARDRYSVPPTPKPHTWHIRAKCKSQPTVKGTVRVAVYFLLKAGERLKSPVKAYRVIKYCLQFYQTLQVQLLLVCSNILCFVQNHILIKCFHIPQNYQKK